MTFHLFRVQSDARSDHFIRLVGLFFSEKPHFYIQWFINVYHHLPLTVLNMGVCHMVLQFFRDTHFKFPRNLMLCPGRIPTIPAVQMQISPLLGLPCSTSTTYLGWFGWVRKDEDGSKTIHHQTWGNTHPLTNDRSSRVAQGFDP